MMIKVTVDEDDQNFMILYFNLILNIKELFYL